MTFLAISQGIIFAVGALVTVVVLWAAFALALVRFNELAERSESGGGRDGS